MISDSYCFAKRIWGKIIFFSTANHKQNADGSFTLRGYAELDDVCDALGFVIDNETRGESSTIGGLLCALVSRLSYCSVLWILMLATYYYVQAGQIPKAGDQLRLAEYDFEVSEVEDNRRILKLTAIKSAKITSLSEDSENAFQTNEIENNDETKNKKVSQK